LINEGKSEAYCKLCKSTIRPQKNDLKDHAKTATHKAAVKALPGKQTGQKNLESCGTFLLFIYTFWVKYGVS